MKRCECTAFRQNCPKIKITYTRHSVQSSHTTCRRPRHTLPFPPPPPSAPISPFSSRPRPQYPDHVHHPLHHSPSPPCPSPPPSAPNLPPSLRPNHRPNRQTAPPLRPPLPSPSFSLSQRSTLPPPPQTLHNALQPSPLPHPIRQSLRAHPALGNHPRQSHRRSRTRCVLHAAVVRLVRGCQPGSGRRVFAGGGAVSWGRLLRMESRVLECLG